MIREEIQKIPRRLNNNDIINNNIIILLCKYSMKCKHRKEIK